MPKVFISYSRRNRKRALRLAEDLKNKGVDVWFDQWEILVGYNLFDSIYRAIRESDYLAVILTKQSVRSKWVKEELDSAKQEELEKGGTKIIPLLFEKCEIPLYLKSKKYANFLNFERGMEELIKRILHNSKKTLALGAIERKDRFGKLRICQNIDSISLIRPGHRDDLFLACLNFEDRSLWSIMNYPSDSIRNILLFDVGEYSVAEKQRWYSGKKEQFLKQARRKLVKGGNLQFVHWENVNSSKDTELIKALMQESLKAKGENIVSIDISAFPHLYFLQLLIILDQLSSIVLRVFYVTPDVYYPSAGTIGIKEIQILPYDIANSMQPNLLIIIPGFSGEAAIAIWKALEPERTIVIIPKRDLWQESYHFIKKSHSSLLSVEGVVTRHSPFADPFAMEEELESLKPEYSDYNWAIAPHGTKLQSLGIHIFGRRNKGRISNLVWAKPLRYLSGYYSKGIGRAWAIFIG